MVEGPLDLRAGLLPRTRDWVRPGMSDERKDGQKGQADDVRDMLRQLASQIKDQIADVDRRHDAAIKTMEQRLSAPGQTMPPPPAQDAPDWDAATAEALTRLYETEAPELAPTVAPVAAPVVAPPMTAKPVRPTTVAHTAPSMSAPMAAPATVGKPMAPAAAAPIARQPDAATPQPAAAPSLRKPAAPVAPIYFADPPVPAGPPTYSQPTPTPAAATFATRVEPTPAPIISALAPVAPAATAATAGVAMATAAGWLSSDRAWLDERLADLHAKVDATLSGFDPLPIVAPINARIDRLEGHLTDALSTVAQKADLQRLSGIETDVAALKDHVVHAREQLKRLDGIEQHLAGIKELADQAQNASENAGEMIDGAGGTAVEGAGFDAAAAGRLADLEAMVRDLHAYAADQQANSQAAPELPDFHGLAEKAAERTAQQIVEQHKDLFSPSKRAELHAQALSQVQSGPSLDDMQGLLDRYQDEQRREQEQMASTLTTMQEALIRLIDRIEELASGEPEAEAAPAAATQYVEVQDERAAQAGRRASDLAAPAAVAAAVGMASVTAPRAGQPAADQPAPRTPPRVAAAAAPPSLPQTTPEGIDADAAAAMAAERARVQMERSQGRRPAMPRPQVTVAPDPADPVGDDAAPAAVAAAARAARKPKGKASMPKRGLIAAAVGGLFVIAAGAIAYPMLGKHVVDAKLGDRIPRVSPATVPPNMQAAPQPAQRPPQAQPLPQGQQRSAIPTETFEPATRAMPAQPAPGQALPTPALPEAQPQATPQRPQPAAGAPLPTQPPPRDAPLPQAAPQGRAIETPVPGSRRATPETVTDDLSSNTQAEPTPAQIAAAMGAPVTTAAVQGISVASSGTMADPTELARRQARMAPAEAQPPASTRVAAETAEAPVDALPRGRAEMPPAQIGPLSMRLAAQQGDPSAAFEVGSRFAEAKGVKQDFQQAIAWYSRAAQQGFGPAQYRLGTIYEGGLHGTQDLPRAKVWYKRAADQGNVKAMHNLAVIAAGNGQSQPDYATAARWFAEAAERGLADSQFNLGVLHESGLGVAKDPLQSYKWFALAARSGDKEALRRRDQLMMTLPPQAAQQAERTVQAWRSKPIDLKANDPRAAGLAWREQQARLMQEMQSRLEAQQAKQQQQQQQSPSADAPQAQPQPPVQLRVPAAPSNGQQAQAPAQKTIVQRTTATIPKQ
jgi:localization factor PodJL